jgi:hypothetical protein
MSETKNLKFFYNNNGTFKNTLKNKFCKGRTLGEHTFNMMLKKKNDNKNKKQDFESINTLDSQSDKRSSRLTKKSKKSQNIVPQKTRALRLKRYKTFCPELNEQTRENYLVNKLSNITNLNIHINIKKNNTNKKIAKVENKIDANFNETVNPK